MTKHRAHRDLSDFIFSYIYHQWPKHYWLVHPLPRICHLWHILSFHIHGCVSGQHIVYYYILGLKYILYTHTHTTHMHTVSLLISGMARSLSYSLNILLDFQKNLGISLSSPTKNSTGILSSDALNLLRVPYCNSMKLNHFLCPLLESFLSTYFLLFLKSVS